MTMPWLQFVRSAGLDPRVRGASHGARGVWVLLLCATNDSGDVVGSAAQGWREIVDAVAGTGASEHLQELRDKGLVLCDVGDARLHLPHVIEWRDACLSGAPRAPVHEVERQVTLAESATKPRRTDDRAVVQRLGALWSKAGADTLDARMAWLDSPAGAAFIAREGRDRAWVLDIAGRLGRRQPSHAAASTASSTVSTDGVNPSTVDTVDAVNPPSLSAPLPLERIAEEKREEQTPERAPAASTASSTVSTDGVNPSTVDSVSHGVNHAASTTTAPGDNSAPRCPTVERTVTAPSAAEVLLRLRGAGKLRLSVSTTHEAELERALSSVSPVWTLAGVERLARHVGAGHLRDGWRPRLDDLRGKDGTWSRLLTLHDEAQDCARCRREDRRSPPSPGATAAPRQTELKPVSDEERKAAARAVMERRKAREKAEASAAAEAARQRMATAEVTHG